MRCSEFWEIADSYLSDELSVESNHDVISHLEHCSGCRDELSARRALRSKLRDAFVNSRSNSMRPDFASTLRSDLRGLALQEHSPRPGRVAWLAIAASLIVVSIIGLILVRQQMLAPEKIAQSPPTQEQQDSPQQNPQIPPGIVSTELATSAVGDHRDCAVRFRLLEKPIELDTAGRTYDPVYINLTKVVVSNQDAAHFGVQFVEAHSCVFEGRRFAHIVLRYHGNLVSFLVTNIPESSNALVAGSGVAGQPDAIVCSEIDGFRVSGFQTARHAVFVISDLPEGENLALTRALAPSVFEHISLHERTT